MTDYSKVKLGKQTAHHDNRVPMLSKYTANLPTPPPVQSYDLESGVSPKDARSRHSEARPGSAGFSISKPSTSSLSVCALRSERPANPNSAK